MRGNNENWQRGVLEETLSSWRRVHKLWQRMPRWVLGGLRLVGWTLVAIGTVFGLTIMATFLHSQGWAADASNALALGLTVALAVFLVLAALVKVASDYLRVSRQTSEEVSRLQREDLRPLLVLPPPSLTSGSVSSLEAGSRMAGGEQWNPRVVNIGVGPALNGEAWLRRKSTPGGVIILTIEPLGVGQHADLASLELPLERVGDLELVLRYTDAFNRLLVSRYRLYVSGEGEEVAYWLGPVEVGEEGEDAAVPGRPSASG